MRWVVVWVWVGKKTKAHSGVTGEMTAHQKPDDDDKEDEDEEDAQGTPSQPTPKTNKQQPFTRVIEGCFDSNFD